MGLLSRFKESKAIRSIQATLQRQKPVEEAVTAARRLKEFGTRRCVDPLCNALAKGPVPLQIEAARTLATIHRREPHKRILGALNSAVLHERQGREARQAAIESLAEVVDVRHAGSFIEVLKSNRSPTAVRAAALRALKQLSYPEVLERLVECCLFGKRLDIDGKIRKWAVRELIALDDHEKLTKIHEIAHGRRKLRYRAVSDEAGGPAALVYIMARVDPKGSVRLLGQMADDENPTIRSAARRALQKIRSQDAAPGSS